MNRSAALVVALGLAASVTACGGSSGGTPTSGATTGSPSAGSTTPPADAGPANAAAARAEITANWQKFFDSNTPPTVSKRLLEKGASLGPALKKAEEENRAIGGQRSADVTDVQFTSPTQANVSYELHAAGRTLNASGVAVLESGTWKVADITFCTLVLLGNAERPVKGC
jgi:hypothetical protein